MKEINGRYARIYSHVWDDERFQSLSPSQPCGQTLWLYLLSTPLGSHIPGVINAGEAALAEVLHWPIAAFHEAFAQIHDLGMARADWRARIVWVPNGISYSPPRNPNVVRSWSNVWRQLPDCALKASIWESLLAHVTARGPEFERAFAACARPTCNYSPNSYRNDSANNSGNQVTGNR